MTSTLPKHIAIIMDGNGRWAKKRFLPRAFGHQAALKRIKEIVRYLSDHGVKAVTLYAFSTENWKRPADEVSFLMNLVLKALSKELKELHANQVQFRALGNIEALPKAVQEVLSKAETLMRGNTGIALNIALNYGGRDEIVKATKEIVLEVQAGRLDINDLTESAFAEHLYTKGLPEVDLMIRTGGETRMSNFLLWQNAYAELYFTDILFPDFGLLPLKEALEWYSTRERRYGMISEQLNEQQTSNKN